jgi:predicted RNase H-like nuclease (RuvC/YqgF family)
MAKEADSQDGAQRVVRLERENEQLKKRVIRLEHSINAILRNLQQIQQLLRR